MTRVSASHPTPTVLRLRAPVAADGDIVAFGLTYRPYATQTTLHAMARAGHASLLVDANDIGSLLVRDPGTGTLIRAACTRPAYAIGLSLPAHAAARRSMDAALTVRGSVSVDYGAHTSPASRDPRADVPCRTARSSSRPSAPTPCRHDALHGSERGAEAAPTPVPTM